MPLTLSDLSVEHIVNFFGNKPIVLVLWQLQERCSIQLPPSITAGASIYLFGNRWND
jgi:hypothetical protein